jgi:small subunit ribosomal protein S17
LDYWIVGLLEGNNRRVCLPINPPIHQSINPFFNVADETKNLEATPAASRGDRKERVGEVIANRMAKTIVVRVERRFAHPRFKKVVTGFKKYYAHDEQGQAKLGDQVRIRETRPLSKTKRWRLVEVVARASDEAPVAASA